MPPVAPRAAVAACLAASLAGCAALQKDATQFEDFVTSPKAQATVATLKVVDTALVCGVQATSGLTAAVEAQVAAVSPGKEIAAAQGYTNLVYVTSSTVCSALSGTLTGATASKVDAVTAVGTGAAVSGRFGAPASVRVIRVGQFTIVQR